ncbi:MAG TPA: hypothetical protein DHV26_14795 [Cytophagales bacterium]|nr:hypothetical protein [Cytophagales bacterium]HRG08072.1 hypothetical protein [Cyclobacteriaceae bacterium]
MRYLFLLITVTFTSFAFGQRYTKGENSLGNPILTDSASTLFIPILYNEALLSSNKIAAWGGYYANLIVYNFNSDSYKKLFSTDTYLQLVSLPATRHGFVTANTNIIKLNRIFLFVKETDTNKSGRIDENDASVLYTVTPTGENLQALTTGKDHVISVEVYGHAEFALVQFQRDINQDGNFNFKDTEYYYRKLDLKTLKWGKEIKI